MARLIDVDELKKDIAENYVFIGFVELLNDFMEVINNAPTIDPVKHGRWIPCEERMPEDDVEVFVYLFERSVPYIAWVEDCRWYTEDFEVEKEHYPTAWMPLPEPYKMDEVEE